eukprot:4710927-Prymnesium_polylepis.2
MQVRSGALAKPKACRPARAARSHRKSETIRVAFSLGTLSSAVAFRDRRPGVLLRRVSVPAFEACGCGARVTQYSGSGLVYCLLARGPARASYANHDANISISPRCGRGARPRGGRGGRALSSAFEPPFSGAAACQSALDCGREA